MGLLTLMNKKTVLKEEAQRQLEARLEREAKALRANLLRRKQQKRLRPDETEKLTGYPQESHS